MLKAAAAKADKLAEEQKAALEKERKAGAEQQKAHTPTHGRRVVEAASPGRDQASDTRGSGVGRRGGERVPDATCPRRDRHPAHVCHHARACHTPWADQIALLRDYGLLALPGVCT